MTKTKRLVCIILGILFALSSLGYAADGGSVIGCLIMFALFAYLAYWAYKKPIVPSKREIINQQCYEEIKPDNMFTLCYGLEGFVKEGGSVNLSTDGETLFINSLLTEFSTKSRVEKYLEIPCARIDCFDYITEDEVKNKSVLARGVVGGIILGPLGAVIGGMSGIGTKTKEGKSFLTINYTASNGNANTIILTDGLGWAGSNKGKVKKIKATIAEYKNKNNSSIRYDGHINL
jgi:hypothetical protein